MAVPLFLQVEVLKCNLEKADQEINQLDDIVDKVVKVGCPCLHFSLYECDY